MCARVEPQPAQRDRLPAFLAPTELVLRDAPKRRLDGPNAPDTAPLLRRRHGLLLYRIHTTEPSHRLLIQLHRGAIGFSRPFGGTQFRHLLIQKLTEFHELLGIHLWYSDHHSLMSQVRRLIREELSCQPN